LTVSARTLARLFEGAFDESLSIDGARLHDTRPRDLVIRFAFGFAVSVIAGIVSLGIGDRAGGLFLAFPAILPASLTLIADKESKSQAEVDAGGALIGATALVAFAVVAWQTLARVPLVVAEGAAFAAWLTASMSTYFAVRSMFRRRRPRPPSSAPDGTGSGTRRSGMQRG
jgi:hypothetical protein